MKPAQAGRGHGDVMQRAAHIWKELLSTATRAESKQVQDVTTWMSELGVAGGARGAGKVEGKSPRWDDNPQGSGDAPSALQSHCAALVLGWCGSMCCFGWWLQEDWVLEVVTIPMTPWDFWGVLPLLGGNGNPSPGCI